MDHIEIFIFELVAIDTLSSGAIEVSEIAALAHETRNNAMEDASFVSESFLAGAESPEVFARFWRCATIHAHLNSTSGLAVDANIEVDGVGDVGRLLAEEAREDASNHLEFAAAGPGAGGGSGDGADGGKRLRHLRAHEENGGDEGGEGLHLCQKINALNLSDRRPRSSE